MHSDAQSMHTVNAQSMHSEAQFLYNPGGSTSKSLFFVQVSSQKYSERSIDSRYNSIHSKFQKSCFSDRTPSSVYSKLYSGSLVEYVYATTSSVTTINEQSVYVCQLDDIE